MRKHLKIIGLCVALVIILSAAGCSSIVSKEDLEDLESQLEDLENQVEDLEDTLEELVEEKVDSPSEKSQDDGTSSDADTSTTEEKATEDTDNQTGVDPSTFSETAVLALLEITEYTYSSDYNNYVFLGVKNNSTFDITIYGEMVFRNAEGALIGTSSSEERAFEAGQELMLDFISDDPFTKYEYNLSVDVETYYDSVLSLLSKEISLTDSKVILAVTNNGDKPAQYVEYTVLFFDGDTVVDYDWGYCTDDDNEIKPGKTNYDEATAYESFDSVLVFLSGRADK